MGGGPGSTVSNSTTGRANESNSPHWAEQIRLSQLSAEGNGPHHYAKADYIAKRGTMVDNSYSSTAMSASDSSEGRSLAANGAAPHRGIAPAEADDESGRRRPDEAEAEEKDEAQRWTELDLSGIGITNLSTAIFDYAFLTVLFVPHNNISYLPPAIGTLTHLRRLDVSSNKLTSLPAELGLLFALRELSLFDNRLTTLPAELGSLFQLEMIGIEGNPSLHHELRELVERGGTPNLISYLRDNAPMPPAPPEREWFNLDVDMPSPANEDDMPPESFSMLCYNVLCDKYATESMYGYTPSWALSWEYRKEQIMRDLTKYPCDIVCLQVRLPFTALPFSLDAERRRTGGRWRAVRILFPAAHAGDGLRGRLPSQVEGEDDDGRGEEDGRWLCNILQNIAVRRFTPGFCRRLLLIPMLSFSLIETQLVEFNLVAMRRHDFKKTEDMFNRVMTKDQIASIALLEHRLSGGRVIVANVHMYWDHEYRDVKLVQAAILMDEIESVGKRFARLPARLSLGPGYTKAPAYSDGNRIPTLICGDFNSIPNSGVYEYLVNGRLPADHSDWMDHLYGKFTTEGLSHSLTLRSSYAGIGEMPFTNYTPGFKGGIDYIWYSANALAVTGVLGPVETEWMKGCVGIPNAVRILASFFLGNAVGSLAQSTSPLTISLSSPSLNSAILYLEHTSSLSLSLLRPLYPLSSCPLLKVDSMYRLGKIVRAPTYASRLDNGARMYLGPYPHCCVPSLYAGGLLFSSSFVITQ